MLKSDKYPEAEYRLRDNCLLDIFIKDKYLCSVIIDLKQIGDQELTWLIEHSKIYINE